MKRVVITGFGAVTPLGNTFQASWEAVKSGKSGISPVTKFDVSEIPWKVAGEVKGFDAETCLESKEVRRLDPFIHYAVAAAGEALKDAGLFCGPEKNGGALPSALEYRAAGGVIIGSSRGGIGSLERAITARRSGKNLLLRPSAYLMPATTIGMASSYVAQKFGIRGYCLGISNACASGTNAVGEAYRLIRSGFKGPVIAGGSEAPLCRLCLEGYGASRVLSKTPDFSASRPFARTRDGFVLSEGACVMVLEDLDSAIGRGARLYGEITGYSSTADAFHQTRPDRRGEVMAMRSAMADAGISPCDVDYLNAHGTSTVIGDRVEAEAVSEVFSEKATSVPVSATKSMTGHMLAASGALEAAFTAMTIKEGIIPPTVNLREKGTDCAINVITRKTGAKINTAISNSFGFGGVNAVLVFKRINHPV